MRSIRRLLPLLVVLLGTGPSPAVAASPSRIFGVTVDTVARLPALLAGLRALPKRPTARVVFDLDQARPADPAPYVGAVGRIAAVADVLGELVDSSQLRGLTPSLAGRRASAFVRALGPSVALWEVGNEVNGAWTGRPRTVARTVAAMEAAVRARGGRAALTLYENEGCDDGPGELSPVAWARRYLSSRVRDGIAFVGLSYYEAQCGGARPSTATWRHRFAALHRAFPRASVGFGEVGVPAPATPATRASAASVIGRYAGLRVPLPYYAGGGFYWYFAEDMLPWQRSPLWRALAAAWAPVGRSGDRVVVPPPAHGSFSYQIGGAFRPARAVTVVDRDRRARPARGVYGVCYLNAFQAQPEELGWWRARHRDLLLRRDGRPVIDTGWNEQLLDTSTPHRRRALAAIVGRWIDGCARAGYRAVEPDNLDSWTRSQGALTAAANLAYARLLIARAHRDGLAIAQKNAAGIAAAGRRVGFDFAIAEECEAYRECARYTAAYGDHVVEVEYPDNGGVAGFLHACRARGARISIVLRDRNVTPAGSPGFLERRCP